MAFCARMNCLYSRTPEASPPRRLRRLPSDAMRPSTHSAGNSLPPANRATLWNWRRLQKEPRRARKGSPMVSSWHRIEIGNHIDLLTGFPFSSEHYTEDPQDIRLLRGDNVVQGTVRWEGVKRWPASQAADLERYQVAENDIVIAMDRTGVKAGLKIAQIRERDLPSLLVQRVARLRTRSGLDQNYLAQCIISYRVKQYVKGIQTETAVPHISSQQICEFTIPIPSIQEQRQIAAILATWDEAVDKLG